MNSKKTQLTRLDYRLISKKGEGTFSEVIKAQSIKNAKFFAIKCMKNHFDNPDQVQSLREIQALKQLSPHPNIIRLYQYLYDEPTGRLALVFELMDINLYELIRGRCHYLQESKVKYYMYQLLVAIDHMHRKGIFHRDIKPENVLLLNDSVKLADFGSCRGIHSKQPFTEYISTRWYRAPECLLTDGYYSYKMDIWGVGCVFFEILSLYPLFPGNNQLDQVNRIHNIIGTPPKDLIAQFKRQRNCEISHYSAHIDMDFPQKEGTGIRKLLPHVSSECIDLIEKLLTYNPDQRPTSRQALKHPYFRDLREQDQMMRKIARVPRSFDSKSPNKSDDGSVVGSVGAITVTEKMGKLKDRSPSNTFIGDDDEVRTNVSSLVLQLPPLKKPYKLHPVFQQKGKKQYDPKKHQVKKSLVVIKKGSYLSPYSQKVPAKKDGSLIAALPSHTTKL